MTLVITPGGIDVESGPFTGTGDGEPRATPIVVPDTPTDDESETESEADTG